MAGISFATDSPAILTVRLSSLGDAVLAAPVLENLKAAWPRGRLSVLVKRRYADLFRGHPAVDEILEFESRGFWEWARELRRRAFDLYVDLHDTPRSRLWGWLSGASCHLRYDKRTWARRRLVWFKKDSPALAQKVSERYLSCLEDAGIPVVHRRPRLFVPAGEEGPALGEGSFLGLAPGALHATKRWPAARFAAAADELIRRLSAAPLPGMPLPLRTVVVGSRADEAAAGEVLASLRGPARNFAGKTSVRELILLVRKCSLFLTNDSGAMHVASALGVPTVAVFGPTVRAFGFFPEEDCSEVVEEAGLFCRPCSLHGTDSCPEAHFRCMNDISVDRVVEAALRVLAKARGGGEKLLKP